MARRTNITDRFGQRLRGLRQRASLSQEEFAERCDLDRTYISGIERGKRNVALRNIEAIARALNITISELLRGV
jgi:transcriptional regulator with XRE-family HTH domain